MSIRDARLTGRPILGICGGSWRLLEQYGGGTRQVGGHSGAMPALSEDRTVVNSAHDESGNTTTRGNVHGVDITPDSMLAVASNRRDPNLPVNSVHWAAADAHDDDLADAAGPRTEFNETYGYADEPRVEPTPPRVALRINARTTPTERHGATVEGFEARHGAPVMGVQWHPEAYSSDNRSPGSEHSEQLINWMAKAGDAYRARRAMTAEFTQRLQDGTLRALNHTGGPKVSSRHVDPGIEPRTPTDPLWRRHPDGTWIRRPDGDQ